MVKDIDFKGTLQNEATKYRRKKIVQHVKGWEKNLELQQLD